MTAPTATTRARLEGGDWALVLMNADGSPGVQADLSTGAKAPFLAPLGWGAIGGGVLLLISAGVLALFGMRSSAPVKSED